MTTHTLADILAEPPAPTLRPAPNWIDACGYSRLAFAWDDEQHLPHILEWLDDSLSAFGENPTTRRAVGGAVLDVVSPLVRTFQGDHALTRRARTNIDRSAEWVDGKELSDATIAALDAATADDVRALEASNARAREKRHRVSGEHEAWSAGVVRAARLALLPLEACRGPLVVFASRIADAAGRHGESQFLAALRRRLPVPPAGYREPGIPRRWFK